MGIVEVQYFLSTSDQLFELMPHDNCLQHSLWLGD